MVRGLFINRPDQGQIGLFRIIDSPHEITDLGVEEADIRGEDNVGILVGRLGSDVGRVWTTGEVVGRNSVGGLAGESVVDVHDSWSTADARGDFYVGGLIGQIVGAGTVTLSDNWAAGDMVGTSNVGGFGGRISGGALSVAFARNWSAGAVAGGNPAGGFLGGVNAGVASVSLSYWNADTSGIENSPYGKGVSLQALLAADFDNDDSWNVGGSGDFPLLTALDRPRQAVYLTRALTRILGVRDDATVAVTAAAAIAARAFRLDTNGRAGSDGAPADPTCAFANGVLRAATGYNGATAELRLLAENAELVAAEGDCEANINGAGEFAATLRLEIAAPAIGGDRARRLTTDYPLVIALPVASESEATFLAEIASGERQWLGGGDDDWGDDGVWNPYDLTLGGADGSAANPWPIYNIWQLQAIASVSVSSDGATMTTGLRLFGDGDNMTAHYRLMNDIDATPTRAWTNGDNAGFAPIPVFRGVLNGDGKVVRGLFIDSGESNVGLFGELGGGADAARIVSLGLLDARIESRARGVGGFAELMRFKSSIVDSWISGFVRSPSGHNGGLIGENDSSCNVCAVVGGWFAGELETAGSPRIGGIVGRQEAAAGKSDFRGLWSLGEIRTSENVVSGELHTGGGLIGEITGAQNPASGYWNIETSGVSSSAGGMSVVGAGSLQTVTAFPGGKTRLEIGATTVSVDFGDSEFSATDAAADFPLLAGDEDWENWQRVGAASGLTRIYAGIGDATALLTAGATATFPASGELLVRIDANGLAADDPDREDATSTPTCAARRENNRIFLEADANYNGVTIRVEAEDASGASTGTVSPSNCGILISATAPYTIIVTFTAGADSQKTLTRRYLIAR